VPEKNVMDLLRLDGKVALIAGGSRGLGKSMALGLAQAGATTVLCSRKQEDCGKAAADVASETGRQSLGLAADVTREPDVAQLFERVMQRFGRLDVLINSAGINIRKPIEQFSLDEFRQVMDLNVQGTWLCCRAAAAVMKAQRSGSVINMGSALSSIGLAERSAYTASKAAVLNLTRTLALEWAPFNVRCNVVCPGPFMTEMNLPLLKQPERMESITNALAFKRWGEMHEIRGAAVFLASEASSYVTGSALYVDGGWTIG
jgi:NAD(P)-dependent dehydrogenase (short-subunit alcohol dehydrogenase family)